MLWLPKCSLRVCPQGSDSQWVFHNWVVKIHTNWCGLWILLQFCVPIVFRGPALENLQRIRSLWAYPKATHTPTVLVCYMHILMRIYYGCLTYTLKGEIRGENLQQKLTCGGFFKSHLKSITVQKNPASRWGKVQRRAVPCCRFCLCKSEGKIRSISILGVANLKSMAIHGESNMGSQKTMFTLWTWLNLLCRCLVEFLQCSLNKNLPPKNLHTRQYF